MNLFTLLNDILLNVPIFRFKKILFSNLGIYFENINLQIIRHLIYLSKNNFAKMYKKYFQYNNVKILLKTITFLIAILYITRLKNWFLF